MEKYWMKRKRQICQKKDEYIVKRQKKKKNEYDE